MAPRYRVPRRKSTADVAVGAAAGGYTGPMTTFLLLSAHASVVLNEILPNPSGPDAGHEWVELYNPGPGPVDLAGWQIHTGTSTFVPRVTLGAVVIAPGGSLVVGEASVPEADVVLPAGTALSLGNAGSSGDAVRLVDALGTVVDVWVYGPDNADGFVAAGGGFASPWPAPGSGETLARLPDGTGAPVISTLPSPGWANRVLTCDLAGSDVGIAELLPDPVGADAGAEWIELVAGSADVDVSGWRIEAGTSAFDRVGELPVGLVVAAGRRVVIGNGDRPVVDVEVPGWSLPNGPTPAAVRLVDCEGTPTDAVVWGDVLRPSPGETLAVGDDGHWSVGRPTPGMPNDAGRMDCAVADGVVLNEVLVDAPGADAGHEWVELFHAGEEPVDLAGWGLQASSAGGWADRHRFDGGTLWPGDRWLIAGDAVPDATHALDGALPNGSDGAGIRLLDCGDAVVDAVSYGGDHPLAAPGPGSSLQRRADGLATGDPSDWRVGVPTPGATNGGTCGSGELLINEVLPDPEGTDAGHEWIELFNPTGEPIAVDGWSLQVGSAPPRPLADEVVGRSGFLVVRAEGLPNGTTATVELALLDCDGQVVDALVYGVGAPDDPLAAASAGAPPTGLSLARREDGVDHDEPADWVVGRPTPGTPNGIARASEAPQGGCGGGSGPRSLPPPDPEGPGGCVSAPGPLWAGVLVGVLGAFRRRRPASSGPAPATGGPGV